MNKKGNIIDIIFVIVILFAIGIAIVAVTKVFSDVTVQINDSQGINNNTKQTLNNASSTIPGVLNALFMMVFFGSFLSIAIAAFLIRSSAIFFFIAVLLITIFAFVAGVLSNVYFDYVASDPATEAYVEENFGMLHHLLNNYVIYVIIMGFLTVVALYAKPGGNIGTGI